ncbi:hypothetical protein C8024_01365 [Sphingopyxis sp. BSNA05]|uniref:hypothetical protein n=1 Tax=Sphingopyxis sp. BSNA05 TaxID=1236614 RepID=UPI0015662525|nr:hypothetical protein [Sphingopyxis sp. BSNA05]NRD88397.1 hypothetical protein [Sphingopyxis sp. BSNA05]
MTRFLKTALTVLAVTAAPLAVGSVANAQVSGIATANPTLAIAKTKALSAAYAQIGTQYKSYFDQIDTRNKTLNGLRAQLDTNNDKQLTQEELDAAVKAKTPFCRPFRPKRPKSRNCRLQPSWPRCLW